MTNVLVIQPVLSAYRVPFYESAAPVLADRGFTLKVVYGQPSKQFAQRGDSADISCGSAVPTRMFGSGVQPWALRRWQAASFDPDLVVVQQTVKALETYPLLLQQRFRRRPGVAMWGHGRSYSTPQGRAAAACKQWLTRRCEWFFAYTQGGADHVTQRGFPRTRVTVMNNTIDTDSLRSDLDAVSDEDVAAFREQHGLTPGMTALFIGGVDDAKGFSFLMSAAAEANRLLPGFRLLVAGQGERLAEARAIQAAGGAIRALGRVQGRDKALALKAADVLWIPSAVGLVAVDSLVGGRPIITRLNHTHGPEVDYLVDGRSAWLLPAASTSGDFAASTVGLVRDSQRLSVMQANCQRQSESHSLADMVGSFVCGVLAWDNYRRAGM